MISMENIRLFFQQLDDKKLDRKFTIVNAILIAVSVLMNVTFNGGFCVFVPWAMILQIICFINIVTFIWVERTRFWHVNALICGISTGVYAYWLLFLEWGILVFPVPIWFLFLLIWKNVVHPVRKVARIWYFSGVTLCVAGALVSALLFSSAAKKIQNGEYDTKNPMTERILGMHFRYHTRICPYDGWRPPLHDPAMVLGMRLTGDKDPLKGLTLESRLVLYHTVYPSHPVKADCACSIDSKFAGYFDDYLWKALDFKPMKVLKKVGIYNWSMATSNNGRLAEAGFPISFPTNSSSMVVIHLKDGSDTISLTYTTERLDVVHLENGIDTTVSEIDSSCFDEVALVEFDGQLMYRLTCRIKSQPIFWETFVLQNGIQFTTAPFNARESHPTYWLASESIDFMDSVEIFYPIEGVRDTVKIYRVESQ